MKRVFGVFLAVVMAGCARKQIIQNEPIKAKVIEPVATITAQESAPIAKKTHVVKKGECLWLISGKEYGDPFEWPIIFQDNRDQIQDEDSIEIGQNLKIEIYNPPELVAEAHKIASDEPPYSSHGRKSIHKHKVQ